MTGDRRILVDDTDRTLARIVDGLHDIATALDDRHFAIVGGIAVLTHVQGHRVTQDIDSAVRGRTQEIHDALLVVAEPDDGDADVLLPNGVPVDLLVAAPEAPRSSLGRGGQAKRREATGHALRWAIDTATSRELVCEPENPRGPVAVPVASVSALLAMKAIALTDLARGEKTVTDRLDLWLLLTDDVDRAAAALQQLGDAPPPARRWVAEVLVRLLRDDPENLVHQIAAANRAPRSVDDAEDVWQFVVEPHLELLRR